MFTSSTKYRSHAIKEPFRHRPAIIAFYRQKTGGTKNYGFYYHCLILETRVYILLTDKYFSRPGKFSTFGQGVIKRAFSITRDINSYYIW